MNKVKLAFLNALKMFGEWTVLDEDFDGYIVAKDEDDNLSFILTEKFFNTDIPEYIRSSKSRNDFEKASIKWLMSHPEDVDMIVHFNIAEVYVISKDRAFVRHVINWPNDQTVKGSWIVVHVKED